MPLPDVLIFICRPELEAAFRALEGLFGVAAAADMDVEGNARASSVVRSADRFVGEGAIGGVGRSSSSEVRAAQDTQCSNSGQAQSRRAVERAGRRRDGV
jgi:hypothetical protein